MVGARRITRFLALLSAVAVSAVAALLIRDPSIRAGLSLLAAIVLGGTPTLCGLLVSRKDPPSWLGPLLVVPGCAVPLAIWGSLLDAQIAERIPGSDYVTAASQGAWILGYVVIGVPLLVFPDGRISSRGGRRLLIAILADAAVFIVVCATAPGPFLPPNQGSPHVFGTMPTVLSGILSAASLIGLPLTLIALVAYVWRRYRTGDAGRRRQFRWLTLCAALLPVTLVASWLSYVLAGNATIVLLVGVTAILLSLPVVIALAVIRPDIFDVDRVIAGAATHTTLTALLLATFTIADGITGLVLSRSAPAVAVAVTALVAVLLAPARGWLQRRVDRWLYPARKAAYSAIDELHRDTIAGLAEPEGLQDRLRGALRDPDLVVGYRTPRREEVVDAMGRPFIARQKGAVADVRLGAQSIGWISAGPQVSAELLRGIAVRAAPLVELARLRVELNRALGEADASRARLIRVGYEERVKLERDLHDGAQQRLVALGMSLRLAQRRLSRGVELTGVLDAAVTELGTAVSELRQLAHGIRPSCLDDGLVPALSSLVSGAPVPIILQVSPIQVPPDLETTAYYVAAEALANAIKHAHARRITLEVNEIDGDLLVRVSDDGVGAVQPHTGSGLVGLADRVGAHGGRFLVSNSPGRGTIVEAMLPCASS
jgi:signal transduction histidine kinase